MHTQIRPLFAALAIPLVAALALAACGDDDEAGGGGLRVVSTVAPIGALVAEVGGDHINASVIVGAGADPHDYQLRPSDRRAIDDAAVVFRVGLGLDAFLDDAIAGAGTVVTLGDGLDIEPDDDHETEAEHEDEDDPAGEDGHDHGDVDPHVWQNIDFDKALVDAIAEALAAADTANADAYRANATAYKAVLDDTDRQIRDLIESIPPANRKMVTNHDAFGYFIERYGLDFIGAVIPSLTTSAEPSAGEVAELSDLIRAEGVKAIFAESSVDPTVARQIAADTGAAIIDDLYGDSLGQPGSGAETVHGMLLANATKIAEALR